MNIIYETTKERGATILMPSAMVDAMNPGAVLGLASLAGGSTTPAAPTMPASGGTPPTAARPRPATRRPTSSD
jgi:hypothetical protein